MEYLDLDKIYQGWIEVKFDNQNETYFDIKLSISKLDYTKYNSNLRNLADEYGEVLYNGGYNSFTDENPNIKEIDNKEHSIKYIVRMRRRDGTIAKNEIIYNQKDWGITTAEIILIILSAAFYALAIFFFVLAVKNMKIIKGGGIEEEIKSGKIDKLLE